MSLQHTHKDRKGNTSVQHPMDSLTQMQCWQSFFKYLFSHGLTYKVIHFAFKYWLFVF